MFWVARASPPTPAPNASCSASAGLHQSSRSRVLHPCAAHPLPNGSYSQLNGARRLCYSNSQRIGHSTDLSPPTVSSFKAQRRGRVASTTDTGSSSHTAALLTLSRGPECPGAKAPAPGEAALCSTPVWLELNQPWRADDINPLKAEAVKQESPNAFFVTESRAPLCPRKVLSKQLETCQRCLLQQGIGKLVPAVEE